MTTPNPQPGQEQRMELKPCPFCGTKHYGQDWCEARPAADPGEYGELVEALTNMARAMQYGPDQAWIEQARDRLETQAATIARLREALEPLARKADAVDSRDKTWGRTKSGDGYTVAVRLGDCRKARAALSPNPTSP